MIQALLLDLDDTLLINDMDRFAPHYFQALVAKVRRLCAPKAFLKALDAGTRAMWYNNGTDGTNAQVFSREFFSRLRCKPEQLMPLLEDFYAHDFDALRQYTAVDPDARVLLSLARQRGYRLAVATQPIFPLVAIQARLRWAGVGADEFPYDYIASYETMSACKPHPRYFGTILQTLGLEPQECMMVGDSPEADLAAGRQGFKTFWVDRGRIEKPATVPCDAQGALRELITLIETGRIDEL